ncbi:MAG TPA: ATP-grasp domain-containing protein [Thermoflexales bacterium]|nr:ATP-grasp domain-containing protein [Thermoflexales bacterium]HQW33851.1 ATP-grasp domain-containing protein [Thermoflexales bacterium]HQZ21493.1 ATP-grasp domain-containing protein [Thermoflexales bacterium]HRA00331.1 ATP-grasp domain-containing protein [Thermoflexales bacterium]
MPEIQPTVLFVTSAYKGIPFIQECKRQGCHTILITVEKFRNEPWPGDVIDEIFYMDSLQNRNNLVNAVGYLMRSRKIDLIVPLDDYEVDTVSHLREYFRMKGMGTTAVNFFRDKLAMRIAAREHGVPIPDFTSVFNYDDIRAFFDRVPPPYLLKPRSEAGSMGIKRINNTEELWRKLDELGDHQHYYLLEHFVPGDVFHVDSITWDGDVKFAISSQYGRPPLSVSHDGGVFTTRNLSRESDVHKQLMQINKDTLKALGMWRGVTHAEFIRQHSTGKLVFLEIAARVGGANIADLIEHASGLNPWQEWARIELANLRGVPYQLPQIKTNYAGIAICLAKQQHPDMSGYTDGEIVYRMNKEYHAGLIVSSPDADRVQSLLETYTHRFAQDFLNWAPPLETGRE